MKLKSYNTYRTEKNATKNATNGYGHFGSDSEHDLRMAMFTECQRKRKRTQQQTIIYERKKKQ